MTRAFKRRRLRARAAAVCVVGAVALAGCTFPQSDEPDVAAIPAPSAEKPAPGVNDPADDPALSLFYLQQLRWAECQEDFECAKLTVPVNWEKPGGQTIEIALLRRGADKEAMGSLVINPGGPGASGIDYAKAAERAFGRNILRNYDIVGFDPRGVGRSAPVKCVDDRAFDKYLAVDGTPDDAGELEAAISNVRDFAQSCVEETGDLIRHVDTISVVRDLDVLRAALGQSRLTYQGASYGTYIGAWYAEKFYWRVGRLVLDGAVDPSLTAEQYVAGQAQGFSRALKAFITNCQSQKECPLRGTVDDGVNQLGSLIDGTDSQPLRVAGRRELDQNLLITGIAQGLYDDQLWPALSIGIAQALTGEGTGMLQLADLYYQRDSDGSYGQLHQANPAIYCLDVDDDRTPAQIAESAKDLQQRFPPQGAAMGWASLGCTNWPISSVTPRQRVDASGAAPILVVGTTEDPATPYEWAQGLASQLESGRLLTWEGAQHTAYQQGSDCIDGAIEGYLLTGAVPEEGKRCR